MMGLRVAAIDIGTVTCRLLVADIADGRVIEVVRRNAITQLGDGWTATGRLSQVAIERTSECVGVYAAAALELGTRRIVAVATSASRDAANGEDFLSACEALGLRPHIISGEREAALSFAGATCERTGDDILVVDVGGGSTEIVLGSVAAQDGVTRVDVELARSVDVGSRRVSEMFLHSDPPSLAEMTAASAWTADQLAPYFNQMRTRPRVMVSVAGTATSLAAIDMALDPYDPGRVHGYELSGANLSEVRETLAAMPLVRRREVIGLEPQRAGVIVGGAIVLETVMALAGVDSTVVSEHDILYGVALQLAGAPDETSW